MDHQGYLGQDGRRSAGLRRAVRAVRWAGVVGGLSQSLTGAAGALLARELTGRESVAGWPQAALVVGAAAAALLLTRLTRTHGRRTALTAGAVLAVIGAVVVLAAAVSRSLTGLLLGSTLLGAGNTTVMLGRYAAGELAPAVARAREMGWVLAATAVGAVVGPALLGPSGAAVAAFGLPAPAGPYLVAAVGYAATAAVLLVGMREAAAGRRPRREEVASPRPSRRRAVVGAGGGEAVAVLGVANLVMVTVMTMAPVHLHHQGVHLDGIGLVVGAHVAGMFAPAPASGWLTDRFGARSVVAGAGVVLVVACATVALGPGSPGALVLGLALLGIGWNAAIVAGSAWLASGAGEGDRTLLEGYGEVAMGIAAAVGAVASGLVVGSYGFAPLAVMCALAGAVLLPLAMSRRRASRRPAPGAGLETLVVAGAPEGGLR